MDVNNIRIITLGNMQGKGELMLNPASKKEPEKLFMRKGSTTIFHKLADKIRGIKQAPYSVELSLDSIFTENNIPLINLKNKSITEGRYVKTTYDSGSDKEGIHIRIDKPIIFTSKSLSEIEIDVMEHSSLSSLTTSVQINPTATINDLGPPAPIDDVGPPPPSDDIGPPPATDIDLDNILNELKGNSPDDKLDAILNEFKKDSPHNELDAIVNELNINILDDDLDKNLEELENLTLPPKDSQSELTKPTLSNNPKELRASAKDTNLKNLKDKFEAQPKKINFKPPSPTKDNPKLAKRAADTLELRYALKEMGLGDNGAIEKLKPRDKNNIGTDNNLKNSSIIIKKKHIANLEKAIDLGQIQFDKTKPNYNQLNRQKEIVETTIKLIASTSILRKSERIAEGRGSLSDLKLQLKREFQSLMIMANNNGYQPENWIKRTADLDSTLRSIDFIREKKSSWF